MSDLVITTESRRGGQLWHCSDCHGNTDDPAAGTFCSDPEAPPEKRLVCPAGERGGTPHRWVLQSPIGTEPTDLAGRLCRCTAPPPGLAELAHAALQAVDEAHALTLLHGPGRNEAKAARARAARLREVLLRRAARADAERERGRP